jgi:hypothetical protein
MACRDILETGLTSAFVFFIPSCDLGGRIVLSHALQCSLGCDGMRSGGWGLGFWLGLPEDTKDEHTVGDKE